MNFVTNLFIIIVNMSITASYVAVGVILVRLLLKKAPKIYSYVLWAPVLFRLVCPFSFNSKFSLLNLVNLLNRINLIADGRSGASGLVRKDTGLVRRILAAPVGRTSMNGHGSLQPGALQFGMLQHEGIQSGIGSVDRAVNASLNAAVSTASVNAIQIWVTVLSLIWLFGVTVLLIYSVASYARIKGALQTSIRLDGNVFVTDAVGTAFVCGFIRPKIYVPVNIEAGDLPYILEHEYTHIRRKDYIIKLLAFLALVLHWFNPLMWLCFTLMSRDMEMSCDENVIRKLGDGAKGGYSNSLLSLSVKRKGILTANPLAFGENPVKARIKNVLSFKKPAFWVTVLAVIAVCAAVIAFTANPSSNGESSRSNEEELAEYISDDYKISLRYPAYWKLNPSYYDVRYEGEDGFFQVGAVNGENMSIDEVTENDAFHKLSPYGSQPQIIKRMIDGQEGRLILPSSDQAEEMHKQAGLIVKYPKAVKIGDSAYHFLILWADKAHIEQIGDTLRFLEEQTEDEKSSDTSKDIAKKEIANLVEENLAVIMSSPKESSNPNDYILAHQEEYEKILKYGGEEALQYMLSQFEKGNAEGLRGHIMMRLCKELLGVRNNVTDDNLSPQEWYNALSIRQEIKLPDFKYEGSDPIEKLVYETEIKMNSRPQHGFTIVAPKIFGTYEEGDFLKVFVTTYSATYKLYGNVLGLEGGSVVPSAITYKKDNSGNYVLEKYEQSKDGAHWKPSIIEFCTMPVSGKKIPGLADKIIEHYTDYDDICTLHWENLYKHLRANGIKDATLYDPYGEVIFTMSSPQYMDKNSD